VIFVLDRRGRPVVLCTEKRARLLLERGRAVICRLYPFDIRLKNRSVAESTLQSCRLKLDPEHRHHGRPRTLGQGCPGWTIDGGGRTLGGIPGGLCLRRNLSPGCEDTLQVASPGSLERPPSSGSSRCP
jgi:hypothetical protein